YELVKQLRLDPATRTIPVVFYTAHYGEREARALALSSGVSYVLTKPAESAAVLSVVARALRGESEGVVPSAPDVLLQARGFDREHLALVTDQLSEKTGDARAANAKLRALVNISLEIASERDADRLLDTVCSAARELFGATYVTLGILDLKDQTVTRFATSGIEAGDWIRSGDRVAGILETVVLSRKTWRGDARDPDTAKLGFPARHPEVQAFLAAPVASPGSVYGWICFVGNEGRPFSQDDEDLVTALAGQVGRIYENGYFHAVAEQRADELRREISVRMLAESAVRHERDRAQQYLDTAEVLLISLDVNLKILLANRYACDVLGWTVESLLGRDWIETCLPARVHETVRKTLHRALDGTLSVGENLVVTKTGKERLISWRNTVLRDAAGKATGTFSSGTDITEGRAMEEQYRQAQKMEAVGRLAGGVAHDFNNLLTVILGHCDLLMDDLSVTDPRQPCVAEIRKAAQRGAGLTRQLLSFSRKQIVEPTLIELNAVVGDLQSMLDRLIGEDVKIVLKLRPDLACVKADRGQVDQIVLNLAVNARDAMPGGGTLTIETSNVEIEEDYARTHLSVKPGPYVVLTVTDTGTGMTPQVQARAFEPFYTTKEIGKGTGLGLSTVHGIAARCGGCVNVYSELGKGTSFKVYFPRVDATATVPTEILHPAPSATAAPTVLLVEDTDGLREVATRLLQRQGYTVLVAAGADEALQQFERHPEIDVLLTDVVMPGASGPDLTRRLVRQRPGLKVIYMSGYTEDAIVQYGVLNPGVAFLHKPFTSESLGQKIREVMTER
ncbi:MAG: response regulator, partial [Acidobacteriota bacterium]